MGGHPCLLGIATETNELFSENSLLDILRIKLNEGIELLLHLGSHSLLLCSRLLNLQRECFPHPTKGMQK